MKEIFGLLVLASLLGFQIQASAMKLSGEEKTYSPVYKASK